MSIALTCPACGHRIEPPKDEFLAVGNLALRTGVCVAYAYDQPIALSHKRCLVLAALMRNAGRALSRDHLMDASDCWGAPHSIAVYICDLRKRVGHVATIRTHWGVGYSIHPRDEAGVQATMRGSLVARKPRASRLIIEGPQLEVDRIIQNDRHAAGRRLHRMQIEREAWPR